MTNPTSHTTILKAHLEGMPSHTIGDEIWHEALDDAIRWEAEATVEHMPARLLQLIGRDQALDSCRPSSGGCFCCCGLAMNQVPYAAENHQACDFSKKIYSDWCRICVLCFPVCLRV